MVSSLDYFVQSLFSMMYWSMLNLAYTVNYFDYEKFFNAVGLRPFLLSVCYCSRDGDLFGFIYVSSTMATTMIRSSSSQQWL